MIILNGILEDEVWLKGEIFEKTGVSELVIMSEPLINDSIASSWKSHVLTILIAKQHIQAILHDYVSYAGSSMDVGSSAYLLATFRCPHRQFLYAS